VVLYIALTINWSAGCVEVNDLWVMCPATNVGKLTRMVKLT
jgi:hypothetical protein